MIDVADSSAVYYYHYDSLGSVVALSDSSGNSCQSYVYSAYGQVWAEYPDFKANPYMFTGRRFDYETGLYYYRARYYNPYIGRFLQTDPIGYGDGINWYAYCRNNPLSFGDPSGNASFSISKITDGPLRGMGLRCTVTGGDIYDACDVSGLIKWLSDNDVFTAKWMEEQDGWTLSDEDETTFWYLMVINKLLGGAENDGFDYGAMEEAGVRIDKHKQINAYGDMSQPRDTWVNFDQDTNRIHWSENITWNSSDPQPNWWHLRSTYSSILTLAHELQEAENHLDGADLNNNRGHGRWSHADAIRTGNILRRNIMLLQPERYNSSTIESYYRPRGNYLPSRGSPPWR